MTSLFIPWLALLPRVSVNSEKSNTQKQIYIYKKKTLCKSIYVNIDNTPK